MSSISSLKRGVTLIFEATFLDAFGIAVNPDSANLYVSFLQAGTRTVVVIPIPDGDDNKLWSAEWNSSAAELGNAYWHIRTGGDPASANEGVIKVEANLANPELR